MSKSKRKLKNIVLRDRLLRRLERSFYTAVSKGFEKANQRTLQFQVDEYGRCIPLEDAKNIALFNGYRDAIEDVLSLPVRASTLKYFSVVFEMLDKFENPSLEEYFDTDLSEEAKSYNFGYKHVSAFLKEELFNA